MKSTKKIPVVAADAAEMASLRQRFPKPSVGSALYQAFIIVGTNAYLLFLVTRHQSSPVAIALYSVLELITLSIISNVALTGVPKDLRVGSPNLPLASRISAIVIMSALLCGIAWLGVMSDASHLELLREARSPLEALRELHVLLPLIASVLLALSGSIADRLRWNRTGGPFVTGVSLAAAPKLMTAILAPIVAVMISRGYGDDNARRAIVWCLVYLAIKSALELLVLTWHFFGMPDRQLPNKQKTGK